MSTESASSQSMAARQRRSVIGRLAWLPIPLLLMLITGLWVLNPEGVYESRPVMALLNVLFTWLASLCICVLTARSFLKHGQPGLLMFGCGSLLWGDYLLGRRYGGEPSESDGHHP